MILSSKNLSIPPFEIGFLHVLVHDHIRAYPCHGFRSLLWLLSLRPGFLVEMRSFPPASAEIASFSLFALLAFLFLVTVVAISMLLVPVLLVMGSISASAVASSTASSLESSSLAAPLRPMLIASLFVISHTLEFLVFFFFFGFLGWFSLMDYHSVLDFLNLFIQVLV